jgi:hypothetical protein
MQRRPRRSQPQRRRRSPRRPKPTQHSGGAYPKGSATFVHSCPSSHPDSRSRLGGRASLAHPTGMNTPPRGASRKLKVYLASAFRGRSFHAQLRTSSLWPARHRQRDLLYLFIFAKGRLPRCDLLKSAIAVVSARSASSAVQVRQRTSNCSLSCKCHNSLPPRWLTGFPLPKSINRRKRLLSPFLPAALPI